MICPHEQHFERDNRGAATAAAKAGPQGSWSLVETSASGKASPSKTGMGTVSAPSFIRQQFPGRAPAANCKTDGCPEHAVEFDTSGGGSPTLRAALRFNPRIGTAYPTISASLCLGSDKIFGNDRKIYI